jgi:hypothetical protein
VVDTQDMLYHLSFILKFTHLYSTEIGNRTWEISFNSKWGSDTFSLERKDWERLLDW